MKKARVSILTGLAALVGSGLIGFGGFVWYTNDVERPKYASVIEDGRFEVRDYPELIVAEIVREGERGSAVRQGFRPLASYIFAKERPGESISMTAPVTQQRREAIAMTAPVTQTGNDAGDAWTIRFIMPSKYTLDDLPKPAGAQVSLATQPAKRRAVVRFSGHPEDSAIASHEAALVKWMDSRGLKPLGPPTYAYYNAPFTPGFLRRNEVMFDIAVQ